MGRFKGKLHTLCEEGRWSEIDSILRSASKSNPSLEDDKLSTISSIRTNLILPFCDETVNFVTTTPSEQKNEPSNPSSLAKLKLFQNECIEKQGFNEWTPLMISCVRAPAALIHGLVQLNPESTRIADRIGSLPLHFVCCFCRPSRTASGTDNDSTKRAANENMSKILTVLLKEYPEAISAVNKWGQTPLHVLFDGREQPNLEAVKTLLVNPLYKNEECIKLSLSTIDRRGRMPLHIAVQKNIILCVLLTDEKMYSRTKRGIGGRSDVSYVVSKDCEKEEMLKLLIESFDEAVRTPLLDSSFTTTTVGYLPLHLFFRACLTASDMNSTVATVGNSRYTRVCVTTPTAIELFLKHMLDYPAVCRIAADVHPTNASLERKTSENNLGTTNTKVFPPLQTTEPCMMMLPLHIACITGVNFETLNQLLINFPESARIATGEDHPLDLFENGTAGLEYKQACRILVKLKEDLNQSEDQLELMHDMQMMVDGFVKRSDLLFVYFPEVNYQEHQGAAPLTVSLDARLVIYPKSVPPHMRRLDLERLSRLEQLIIGEASDPDITELSKTSRLWWAYMCQFQPSRLISEDLRISSIYRACIGRILCHLEGETKSFKNTQNLVNPDAFGEEQVISNINSDALRKLAFVRINNDENVTFEKMMNAGRTTALEAEERAYSSVVEDIPDPMKEEKVGACKCYNGRSVSFREKAVLGTLVFVLLLVGSGFCLFTIGQKDISSNEIHPIRMISEYVIGVLQFVTSLCALFVFSGIISSKETRKVGFNLYMAFLILPDAVIYGIIWVKGPYRLATRDTSRQFLCSAGMGFQMCHLLCNVMLNSVVGYEIYSVLLKSSKRIKTAPLTRSKVCKQIASIYIFAIFTSASSTVDVPWALSHVQPKSDCHFVYGSPNGFFTETSGAVIFIMINLLPMLYISYIRFKILRKKLIPPNGRTRAISLYFLRIISVYYVFYVPMILLTIPLTKSSNENVRIVMGKIIEVLNMFQCLVTLRFALEKDDVYKSIIVHKKRFSNFSTRLFRSCTSDCHSVQEEEVNKIDRGQWHQEDVYEDMA